VKKITKIALLFEFEKVGNTDRLDAALVYNIIEKEKGERSTNGII